MSENCIFCRIIQGEIPCYKVWEDDGFLAFLDINPISTGHTLLIPKEHFPSLQECPDSVLGQLACRLPVVAHAILKIVHAEGYNILNNNGRAAGQLVDHVHFHIIPRTEGDHAISHGSAGSLEPQRMKELAASIKQMLA